jgi:hypothetical protein
MSFENEEVESNLVVMDDSLVSSAVLGNLADLTFEVNFDLMTLHS